jgi:hypothetical protein
MLQKFQAWWAKNYRIALIAFAVKTVVKVGIVMLIFNRCSSDKDKTPIEFGYEYFPAETGSYITYSLDSIIYDDFFTPVKVDTSYWDIKEYFESEFTDQLGRPSIRLERYMKSRDSVEWMLSSVWSVTKTKTAVEKTEDNQRYLKLVFPARPGQVWSGNQHIMAVDELDYLKNWQYKITAAGEPALIEGTLYDDVITVLQKDEETAISKTLSIERFARNIGLVYKELWVLQSQTGIGTPWPGRAEKGFIIKQSITGYGQE